MSIRAPGPRVGTCSTCMTSAGGVVADVDRCVGFLGSDRVWHRDPRPGPRAHPKRRSARRESGGDPPSGVSPEARYRSISTSSCGPGSVTNRRKRPQSDGGRRCLRMSSARARVWCCFRFDGSDNAALAIARAAEMLGSHTAVVLSVWEPVAVWQPYDPATAVTAPLSRLASRALGLDEIARELAEEHARAGTALAREAGFEAESRTIGGKPWRAICDVADESRPSRSCSERVDCRGFSRFCSGVSPPPWCSTHAGRCWWCLVRMSRPERRARSSRTARALRSRWRSRRGQ